MPELGTKYECFECGTKFYDLGKPEPLCPKCGADQRAAQEKQPRPEPVRPKAAVKVEAEPDLEEVSPAEPEEDEDLLAGGDEESTEIEEDEDE